MTQREKLLGFVVGGLLVCLALFSIYNVVSGAFVKRNDEIVRLKNEREIAKTKNLMAKRDQLLVDDFRKRSLPANRVQAQRQFVQWLQAKVEQVGLESESTLAQGVRGKEDTFQEITCVVDGEGDVNQLSELLYAIHSSDNLFRIRQLSLNTLPGNRLKIDMTADALSMAEFDRVQMQNRIPKELSEAELDELGAKNPIGLSLPEKMALPLGEYQSRLASRNLFKAANRGPEIDSIGRQRVSLGNRLTFSAEASDPDGDDVEFWLSEDAPEGAKISSSGRFSWRPEKLGKYEITVYAKDAGRPAAEVSRMVSVTVEEAEEEEEEPEFDESKLAVLTAILQGPRDPEPLMCMYLRADGDYQYLAKGDDIQVGDWSGTVESVEPNKNVARIRTERGEYILPLGKTLAEAQFVAAKKSGD